MNKIKIAFTILAVSFLAACQTAPVDPQPVIEYRTRTQLAVIPDHLLPNCLQPQPPKIDPYTNDTASERERKLTVYVEGLHTAITNCNDTIDTARRWNAQQRKIFLKTPADTLVPTN